MPRITKPPLLKNVFALKNRAVVKRGRGGSWYVSSWPTNRKIYSQAQADCVEAFKRFQQMVKLYPAEAVAWAYETAKNTGGYPRDILYMCTAGTFFEVQPKGSALAPRAAVQRHKLNERINFILRYWQNECAPTVEIWYETFFPAATTAIISLTTFTKRDIMKMRAGVSYRCGVKQLLNDAEVGKPLDEAPVLKNLMKLEGLASSFFWGLFIGEEVSDFVFDWTSHAMMKSGCIPPATGWQAGFDEPLMFPTAIFQQVRWTHRVWESGQSPPPQPLGDWFIPAGWNYNAGWSVTATPGPNVSNIDLVTRLRINRNGHDEFPQGSDTAHSDGLTAATTTNFLTNAPASTFDGTGEIQYTFNHTGFGSVSITGTLTLAVYK